MISESRYTKTALKDVAKAVPDVRGQMPGREVRNGRHHFSCSVNASARYG